MANSVPQAVCEMGEREIEHLRQKVIVQLLHEVKWDAGAVAEYLKELVQHQVVTHEVCEEVRALLVKKGLAEMEGSAVAVERLPAPAAVVAPAQAAAHVAEASSRFDEDFERIELLGRGAFGEVWRARSRVDLKEYAVKMVPFTFSEEEGPFAHPALREARAWADFQHPNAVRYHAAWVEVQADDVAPRRACSCHEFECMAFDSTAASADSVAFCARAFGDESSDGGVVFEDSSASVAAVVPEEAQIVRHRVPAPVCANNRKATLYLQTELVLGGTLREWIDRRNAAIADGTAEETPELSAKAAEDIFRQLVDAVASLHTHGVVHRDIKPANVLLTETGAVRLGDFGLAKDVGAPHTAVPPALASADPATSEAKSAIDTAVSASVAFHTRGVGTPAYASPEQLNKATYGVEADVYALGVVLAELFIPVRTHMERARLLEGIRAGRLPEHTRALCAGAAEAVLRLTSADPQQRPTAQDLAEALRMRKTAPVQGELACSCPLQAARRSLHAGARSCPELCAAA